MSGLGSPAIERHVGGGRFVGSPDRAEQLLRPANESLPVAWKAQSASTTRLRFVATKPGVSSASKLMGQQGDVVVLGRQADTAAFMGKNGNVVLNTPNWTLELNDAFIAETIRQGRTVRLASSLDGNLVQTTGTYAGQPTVFARELEQLTKAGYRQVGDPMVPPGGK